MKYPIDLSADIDTVEVTDAALNATSMPAAVVAPTSEPRTRAERRRAPLHRRPSGFSPTAPSRFSAGTETKARLRLVGWTVLGVGCLLAVHIHRPDVGSLFALPSGVADWAWMACGLIGVWLVPGLWLTAILMRTGAGPTAWLATRIGTALAWYALVGPVLHQLGRGARVTTGGIFIATIAATAAVCLGVTLGLSRRPRRTWRRLVACAAIAGASTQVVIWTAIRVWSYGMNYEHIRRLDSLIVLGCAVLALVGMLNEPKQPPPRTRRGIAQMSAAAAILATLTSVTVLASAKWSPEQRMPSALSLEPVQSPEGVDLAFAAQAIGSDGAQLVDRARFTVSDDTGRVLPAIVTIIGGVPDSSRATVLVGLPAADFPCNTGVKITVREVASGVRIQGMLPERRCG